ncbi:hypothetical protein QLS91_13025 [Flavobacterium sp. LB2P84]|uniref:hypothetical protein n=1 Tax=Flavobacterium yafengii TaxID=3041253 RepID=UPI0024A94F89|nr:hypothetical protein [Flavobacterium yafengii]MDI6033997.1 hypothetical protein [Flavobacterium yafengii]
MICESLKIEQGKVFVYNKSTEIFEETSNAELIGCLILEKAENSNPDLIRKEFVMFLQKNNLNPTIERITIFEKIQNETFEFTIKKIHDKVLKDLHISLRTVNNTFHLLKDAGIIKISNKKISSRVNYFELAG